jgi:flagellar basal-body rod protein FlgC
MDLRKALAISASGMSAQTARLRVIAENLANQDTTGTAPGTGPYRRKTVAFANTMDRALGAETVRVRRVGRDMGDLPLRFDPAHPAADERGYVRVPNVNSFVEVMDMKSAERGYSANLNVMQVARGMLTRTLDMLR